MGSFLWLWRQLTLANPFAHLEKTQRTPYDIFVENVDFDWFNKYLCTGDHFQSDLDIFRFKFMFVWWQTWVKVSSATELTQEVEEEQVSPTRDPPCRLYEKFENEVTMAWKMIHSSTFFCDPMSSDPPVYVSAEVQDPLLGTIKNHMAKNYKFYKQHVASSSSYTCVILHVFCATITERQKTSVIEPKTICVIAYEIKRLF